MAVISVERNQMQLWGDTGQRVLVVPKPRNLVGRVKVSVPDDVVHRKLVQPVIDAYAVAAKKPECTGKTSEQLLDEYGLMLGFHIVSMDDGSDPKNPFNPEAYCLGCDEVTRNYNSAMTCQVCGGTVSGNQITEQDQQQVRDFEKTLHSMA